MKSSVRRVLSIVLSLALAACGGGGGGGSAPAPSTGGGSTASPPIYTVPPAEFLSVTDVQQVIAQAVAESNARNLPSVIAVVDRVGNVLAVYSMFGSRATALTRKGPNGDLDAQGVTVPASAAAIAKAITGAYLSSSGGNAFSSRTASQIVQQHFPPAPTTVGLESGPLFGVQFSSLPCSDVVQRGAGLAGPGPRRSPLGLSADPGGFPLYKNGVLVGGVGVMADGDYGFDPNILDVDDDAEENIAWAASAGLRAPVEIRADRVTVDGTALRFSDASDSTVKATQVVPFNSLVSTTGRLVAVNGYHTGAAILPGVAYGTEASGLRLATAAEFSNPNAMVLSDGAGNNRFPIRGGTDAGEVGTPLTDTEVRAVLEEAFIIMSRARGQIRRPLDSRAQVTIAVVDTRGQILGVVRAPDAPVFGIDVSVQKARTVSFFSNSNAAFDLLGDPSSDVRLFVQKVRDFYPDQTALTGQTAYGNRAIGNLSRPYFPDGEIDSPNGNGPLSRPIRQWSPLSTGLQSALIIGNIATHLGFINGFGPDTPARCTSIRQSAPNQNRLQNGIQIFSGGVPIYRGPKQIGGIGISGDGIDQDDMISFLGLYNGARRVGTINEADPAIRSDTLLVGPEVKGRLRYVNCPFAPFLDTSEQNVCQGK